MDVQNLSVLGRYILDGMSQIRGALTATTPRELSNTSIKSKSPHKEGHTKTAFIKNPGHQWSQCPSPNSLDSPHPQPQPQHMALTVTYGMGSMGGMWVAWAWASVSRSFRARFACFTPGVSPISRVFRGRFRGVSRVSRGFTNRRFQSFRERFAGFTQEVSLFSRSFRPRFALVSRFATVEGCYPQLL